MDNRVGNGRGCFEDIATSPPKSHLGGAHSYHHVGECTLPLGVLAAACTMRNEALRKRYRALRNVTGALRIVTGHYRMLRNVIERCGTLQNVRKRCGNVTGYCGPLRNIKERCGTLQDVTGALQSSYGIERYGTITENIDFAHH